MRKLLTICLFMVTTPMVNAQGHQSGDGRHCCYLISKGCDLVGFILCPACEKNEKREREAKTAEDKRRADAVTAKTEADKKTSENLRLEKIRIAKEEEKLIRDKKIADEVKNLDERKRYKQIADAGLVKSNTKGSSQKINLSNIESFKDDKRKVYGFLVNKKEILIFPYDSEAMNINKIDESNIFVVDVWETPNKYSYSYLIEYTGKRINVDGIDKSNYRIWVNPQNKLIFFYNKISTEETGKGVSRDNQGLGNFHNSRESALADVQSYRKAGLGMFGDEIVCYDTRYTLDFNGNILEKLNGYTIRIID